MKILILDAGNSNTLAIVRYLAKQKAGDLYVAGYNRYALSFFSKYISGKFILTAPGTDSNKFLGDLTGILQKQHFDLVMPVGFQAYNACMNGADKIRAYSSIILPPKEGFEVAASKIKTYRLAGELGIPYPHTFILKAANEIETLEINYPAVVKAPMEMGKNVVEYVHSKKELIDTFKAMCIKHGFAAPNLPVIQEYVEGGGYGFFAYYDNGVCKRIFMHRRVREYPVSGGASVCAESFYDEALKASGMKILDALKWNGVAMVEFKKDKRDGQYKLMEINPKFWGSLELALAAGVNFPYFLVQKNNGEKVEYSEQFKKTRFHWLLNGELFHFLSRPQSFFAIFGDLFAAKNDIWLRDPLPNLFQVVYVFVHYYKKLKKK